MIAKTMFCNDIISYFCCMDITEIFINKRKTGTPKKIAHISAESTLVELGALGVILNFYLFFFFDEISLSKQKSPRWDAAFCGVTSGAIRFAYVPQKGRQAYCIYELTVLQEYL